jgi:hypothetical protein
MLRSFNTPVTVTATAVIRLDESGTFYAPSRPGSCSLAAGIKCERTNDIIISIYGLLFSLFPITIEEDLLEMNNVIRRS